MDGAEGEGCALTAQHFVFPQTQVDMAKSLYSTFHALTVKNGSNTSMELCKKTIAFNAGRLIIRITS